MGGVELMHNNQKGVALVEALVAAVIVGIGFHCCFWPCIYINAGTDELN
jgi:hypothetical protein